MTTKTKRIAVFIDAENVGEWIKQEGISQLLEELKSCGQIVIRRAYGVWSRPQLAMHQAAINKQGFELIHCYHPVTGKNTADIQMTVDAIECAWQLPNINCFVLVTGDSDFSPVFRRLREMDKEVIGVGRHSALSECVKTSCTRFIYTDSQPKAKISDQIIPVVPPTQPSSIAQDNELNAVRAIIKHYLSETGEAVNISKVKSYLLQQKPSFNEKTFGFKSFTDLLKTIDGIILSKVGTVNSAQMRLSKPISQASGQNIAEDYRRLLKKNNFILMDAKALKLIYKQATANKIVCSEVTKLKEIVFKECQAIEPTLTKKNVNQAFHFFIKLDLVHTETTSSNTFITVKKIALKEFLLKIDQLMITTLMNLSKIAPLQLKAKEIKKITISSISKDSIKKLVGE